MAIEIVKMGISAAIVGLILFVIFHVLILILASYVPPGHSPHPLVAPLNRFKIGASNTVGIGINVVAMGLVDHFLF
jgi:hypothetical protein